MQIHPPTPAHKHARKHISAFPVSIRRINVPSITAYYRPPPPLADGLEKKKRLTLSHQRQGAALPTWHPASILIFQKATPLIHEGNTAAYIKAI